MPVFWKLTRPSLQWLGLSVCLLALPSAPAHGQDTPEVRRTLRYLTSRHLHGRGYTHHGDQRAAAFLAKHFKRLGLLPFSSARDYTQPFSLTVNTFPGNLSVTADQQKLRPGHDFIVAPESGGGRFTASVVHFDSLVFSQEPLLQQFLAQPLQAVALAVAQQDYQRAMAQPLLAQKLQEARAIVVLIPGKLTASLAAKQAPQPRLLVAALAWPPAAKEITIDLQARLQQSYRTQNVLGYIPGTARPDSLLVVTAHYDHLGELGRHHYFPGANDNASGTSMLLQLARHFSQPAHRLRYTLVFIGFSGEEAGLLGSRYFTAHPLFPLGSVRFLINLDLVGTGDSGATVVNGTLHPKEFQILQQLNSGTASVGSLAARGRAANSDHFPFSEAGVPAFFLYTRGGIAAYHDIQDKAETLPLTRYSELYRLLTQFLTYLTH
ncbi:M28 family metallopeptidase [Hymenobacter sp. BT730]|uniref:M28 family metallopeptidase n=1 Tax=Hymenobacter sp. BT730 TaxID=3063332 RepID=UPI0026DFCC1E|nr:M28 family peptidase [Hymenobacter sp. BT730]